MTCQVISNIESIADLIVYPTICIHFFYAFILLGIFLIIFSILFFSDREKYVKADAISSLGVSAIVILSIALIGTLIENSEGIQMISQDIMIYTICFSVVFIGLWFAKAHNK